MSNKIFLWLVYPETGENHKTRVLHHNLLLLVNDLPVEAPPQRFEHVPKRQTIQRNNQLSNKTLRKHPNDTSNSESEESTTRYWLRVPGEERKHERQSTYHYLPTVIQRDPAPVETNRQVTVPVRGERLGSLPVNENQSQRDSQSVTQSLPDSVPPEIDSEGDDESVAVGNAGRFLNASFSRHIHSG